MKIYTERDTYTIEMEREEMALLLMMFANVACGDAVDYVNRIYAIQKAERDK